jgi:diguanylate cyclase (GGDEF)-like protein
MFGYASLPPDHLAQRRTRMLDDRNLRPRLAAAMFDAQSGLADAALVALDAIVAETGSDPTYAQAVVEYVRAIATFELGRYEEGLLAIDRCIETAHAIEEPGWESVGRSLRVAVRARMAAGGGDSIDDLVRAEATLAITTDRELAAWAHVGLGSAYQVLRLYELALPHREFSTRTPLDVIGLPESEVIDWLNLADCNLRIVQELEQLADPTRSEEIETARLRAAEAAHTALAVARRDELDDRWSGAALLDLAIAQWPMDPAGAAPTLAGYAAESQAKSLGQEAMIAICFQARALAANGDLAAAVRVIEAAADAADTTVLDPDITTLVHWTATQISAAAGEPGGVAGRRFGVALARRWWSERERSLWAVRNALALEQLGREHEKERRAARHDALTGVGNRRAFDEWLAHADDAGWPVLLLCIDIDDFKSLNDAYGHAYGDAILVAVARALQPHARSDNLVTRIGGDEFAVLIRDEGDTDVETLRSHLRSALARIGDDGVLAVRSGLEVSIGAASTGEGLAIGSLMAAADGRMYDDKRSNRTLV